MYGNCAPLASRGRQGRALLRWPALDIPAVAAGPRASWGGVGGISAGRLGRGEPASSPSPRELEETAEAGCGVGRAESPPTWSPNPRMCTSCCQFPPSWALGSAWETFLEQVSTGHGARHGLHGGRGAANETVPPGPSPNSSVTPDPPTGSFSGQSHPNQGPPPTPGPACRQGRPISTAPLVQDAMLAHLGLGANSQGASASSIRPTSKCLSSDKVQVPDSDCTSVQVAQLMYTPGGGRCDLHPVLQRTQNYHLEWRGAQVKAPRAKQMDANPSLLCLCLPFPLPPSPSLPSSMPRHPFSPLPSLSLHLLPFSGLGPALGLKLPGRRDRPLGEPHVLRAAGASPCRAHYC